MSAPTLISNSRWNLLAFAFTLAAQFLIVPLVIRAIGLDAFGRAGLVIAAWAPLVLVGTVLGQAATRQMAARLADGDSTAAAQLAAAALTLCAAASAGGALLFIAAGPSMLAWLDPRGGGQLSGIRAEVMALAPGWVAQQFFLVLQGTASARQDFKTIAQISALSALFTVVCTIALVHLAPDALGYLHGVSLGFIASAAAAAWLVRGSRSGLPWTRQGIRSRFPELLHFGKWQVVAQLAGTFGNQIDRYVLATFASPAVIGRFNAANRLQEAAYVGVIKASEVLFPRFGAASSQGPDERLALLLRASWFAMVFSCAVLAPMIVLAEPLMRLWAGVNVSADGGARMLQILVLGGLIGSGSNVLVYYMMGMGENATVAVLSLVYSLLTIALSIVILREAGPAAAGVGLALASAVRVLMATGWAKFRLFPNARLGDLLTSTVLPGAVAGALAWALSSLLPMQAIHSWWLLIAAFGACAALVAGCVVAASCMTTFGRLVAAECRNWLTHRWAPA